MSAQVYLFTGPEFGEKNDKIDSIKTELKTKLGDVEYKVCYASDNPVSEVVSTLQSGDLFSAAICVVYREAELIKKKEDIASLDEWISSSLNNSETNNVLILVSDETSVDKKLEDIIPKSNRKIFWEMFEDRKEAWLKNFFIKNGFGIEDEAVSLILDMIDNNTESLRTECSRFFFCYPSGSTINTNDVEKILAHNREENAFTLFDSMTEASLPQNKRFENALSIVQKILLTKNSSPVPLIAGLASCFRKLALWHTIHSGNAYLDEFALKKNGFLNKKAIAQYTRAAGIWNFNQTSSILALLSNADMDIRFFGSTFQNTQLFLLIYEIVMKNGGSCSKYVFEI